MASFSSSWSIRSFFFILQLLWSGNMYADGCYPSIISFGDSLADTGNIKYLASKSHKYYDFLQPPFGETFFHQPTGRCSNGRLIIDFLAETLGLPLIPPFLHDKESDNVVVEFGQGVNYAVVGATALDALFHEARGYDLTTNASLRVQLEWFKQSLPSICSNASDCRNLIGRSLMLMGEFGGSDYTNTVFSRKSVNEAKSFVPFIIDNIISAVNELIDMGAQTLMVAGTVPLGCSSSYLTVSGSENEKEYDNTTGCLIRYNKLAEYHNKLLQTKLDRLRELHPKVIIIYADYYNAAMQIINSPEKFGFTKWVLKSCCGGGGLYNFNLLAQCGSTSATVVCDDPDMYVFWDGIHFTEAANRIISKSLFQGLYTTPRFNSLCPTTISQIGIELSNSI